MGLLDPTRDLIPPSLKNAKFEGYVVDVNDPEKRQRVRVRIPVLHRDIPDDKLPWSNQQGTGQANAGGGVGAARVPDKFAKVSYNLLDDDPHDPQYGPTVTSDDVNKGNELLEEDYPNTVGEVDSHGNRWSVNKATGDVVMVHKSGATIAIDGGGNVSIGAAGDLNLGAKGNVIVASGGKLILSAQGVTDITGSTVELNTNGPTSPNVPSARTSPSIPNRANQTSL